MRTFAVGDIHGTHKALMQVLERSGFDRENDRLISLGDLTDYNPESALVVEELLSLPNMIAIKGNHDIWTADWLINDVADPNWVPQGGQETMDSYYEIGLEEDPRHHDLFAKQPLYYIDDDNRLYVHAGFDPRMPLDAQGPMTLCWDRRLWNRLMRLSEDSEPIPDFGYESVFIGHTPTIAYYSHFDPVRIGSLWNLDQGAKAHGKLTLMDVETKEFWQSDHVNELYS